MGSPDGLAGNESTCIAGDPGLIPGSERSSGDGIGYPLQCSWASLVAQLVKNPPAIRETWILSLGWEDPLERDWLPSPVSWPGEVRGLYSTWNSSGQNSLSLLQGIFPTQGLNSGLSHCRQILYQLSHKGSPPRSKCLLISWLQSLSTVILEPKKIKSVTTSTILIMPSCVC